MRPWTGSTKAGGCKSGSDSNFPEPFGLKVLMPCMRRHQPATKCPLFPPPALFHQPQSADGHAPVHRLAHVADRKQGHAAGGQGFHFHAGLAGAFGAGVAQRILTVVFFGVS